MVNPCGLPKGVFNGKSPHKFQDSLCIQCDVVGYHCVELKCINFM